MRAASAESRSRWAGWVGPIIATVIGGILRLVDLGRPHAIVFDETYYAKDALSLLRFGYERDTVEGADELIIASDGDWRSLDIFTPDAAYVVHPPFGKWVIAAGEYALGMTPTGWRIAVAVLGTLSILMLGRIVLRMTGNPLVGFIAALLLALDGLHIVMSRTALLDGVLAFLVLAAFGALIIDRDWARRHYTAALAGSGLHPIPLSMWRPWRLVAAVLLGLVCSVKWSGLWFLAAFGLLTVVLEVGTRRRAGLRRPWRNTLTGDVLPAAVTILSVAAITYLVTWTGWFASEDAWKRDAGGSRGVWGSLNGLAAYHGEMYRFHVGVDSEHSYRSPAWGWPVLARPTSFAYESVGESPQCPAGNCSSAVTAIGNPIIWWAGVLALLHQLFRWLLALDWRAGAVVTGFIAGWVPWLLYPERTIFGFYAVVLVPFLAAALALSLGRVLGGPRDPPERRLFGVAAVSMYLLAVIAAAWWMFPVWTGDVIPYGDWLRRMWWSSWI